MSELMIIHIYNGNILHNNDQHHQKYDRENTVKLN